MSSLTASRPNRNCSVTSSSNESYPPECSPTVRPLSATWQAQSTAPKLSQKRCKADRASGSGLTVQGTVRVTVRVTVQVTVRVTVQVAVQATVQVAVQVAVQVNAQVTVRRL